jgi:hypothetical protein
MLKIGSNSKVVRRPHTLREILEDKYPELLERSEAYFDKYKEFQDVELTVLLRNCELLRSLRRIIEFGTTTIIDERGNSVHNNNKAWKIFIDNEIKIFTEINIPVDGSDTNIPDFRKIEYNDIASYISRYENAQESKKDDVFNQFCKFMNTKYFNGVLVSDFLANVGTPQEYAYLKLYLHSIFSLVEELRIRLSQLCTELAEKCDEPTALEHENQLKKLLDDIDCFPLDEMMNDKIIDLIRLDELRPIHDWRVFGGWTFRDIIGTIKYSNGLYNKKLLRDGIDAPLPKQSTLETLVDDNKMV